MPQASLAILVLWLAVQYSYSTSTNASLVFVIVNQVAPPHYHAAQNLALQLTSQAQQHNVQCKIYIASDEWPNVSAWTYFPLMDRLSTRHRRNGSWVVMIGEQTVVKLPKLLDVLHGYDPTQLVFLGRGVSDHEETIIHHYTSVDPHHPFLYVDARAGIILSFPLIYRLAKRWSNPTTRTQSEFNIDAAYEFSSYIQSAGVELTNHSAFCVSDLKECAIVFSKQMQCECEVEKKDIHFAVKTCSKFHAERIPVIQDTWLGDASNYAIYSDIKDTKFGTVSLGVANTERGHCGKTMAIIRHAAKIPHIRWLVIVDDDTLISISRLSKLLSCYDYNESVALGERYGFAATSHGYDYLTGGAGMVFSKTLVDRLASPSMCECPSNDTPDDMYLGVCLRRLDVPATHSSAFHQARPKDYPAAMLEGEAPVSFHKYWLIDPRQVYQQYLYSNGYDNKPPKDQDGQRRVRQTNEKLPINNKGANPLPSSNKDEL